MKIAYLMLALSIVAVPGVVFVVLTLSDSPTKEFEAGFIAAIQVAIALINARDIRKERRRNQ